MGKLSGIVSNPPYIPRCKIPGLQAEVGRHEPILALDGGESGMEDLLHLCRGLAAALEPGGFFAFEVIVLHMYFSMFIFLMLCILPFFRD